MSNKCADGHEITGAVCSECYRVLENRLASLLWVVEEKDKALKATVKYLEDEGDDDPRANTNGYPLWLMVSEMLALKPGEGA